MSARLGDNSSSWLKSWGRSDPIYPLVDSSLRISEDIPSSPEHRHIMASNVTTALNSTTGLPVAGKLEFDAPTSASSSQTSLEQPGAGKRGTTWATTGLGSDHYRPVDTYEGLHRYDPDFEWEPEEERKVVRKVDSSFRQKSQSNSLTYFRLTREYAHLYA
jgi:hypothetical protein